MQSNLADLRMPQHRMQTLRCKRYISLQENSKQSEKDWTRTLQGKEAKMIRAGRMKLELNGHNNDKTKHGEGLRGE